MTDKSQTTISTRDPRRSGTKAAIIARLRDRLKTAIEFSEPGHDNWRRHGHERDLLLALISEFEGLQDV